MNIINKISCKNQMIYFKFIYLTKNEKKKNRILKTVYSMIYFEINFQSIRPAPGFKMHHSNRFRTKRKTSISCSMAMNTRKRVALRTSSIGFAFVKRMLHRKSVRPDAVPDQMNKASD